MQNAAKRPQINAERGKRIPKSLQNAAKRPPINAERSKTTQNQCRTQQIDAASMQNAHTLEYELIL